MEGHETLGGRMNFEGRLLKKNANFAKKQQKIDANFRYEKDGPKKPLKIRFGRVLGSIWEGLGEGLGGSWASFGSFWGLLGRFFRVGTRAFLKHWSKMGSKRASD